MSALLEADQPRGLLRKISGPPDLQNLSRHDLTGLAAEIRAFLIENVSKTGGHLGANLGVVELTVALHRVFTSPHDLLLFDTGHQAYVHKMLTGRLAEFSSLRQSGGMSGYPSRSESDHDVIENSHASTALSYADGLAKAFELRGVENRRIVVVVGDGAMTGGMCWEALNNIGAAPERPVIIVLNDNGRSYLPTIGGFARHLAELRSGGSEGRHNLFRELGLLYLGPIDGHDVGAMEDALREAAVLHRPVVVHCVTAKGRGYAPAEVDDEDRFHTIGVIDPATGRPKHPGNRSWTSVFAEEITAIGEERKDVVCLTAAMLHPVGLGRFAARFPERVFDIGIAEQHAVTSAAGLAIGGLHPVVAIYAAFIGRAVDQLIMDVALHQLPVTIVTDRAGVTGPDGASHHGMWDASILPVIPGLKVASPRDPCQLRELLREAVDVTDGPTVIRYPKANVCAEVPAIRRYGTCDILREDPGAVVLLVSVGPLAAECLAAAAELASQGVSVSVVDPRWTTPLDPALLEICGHYELVLAVEDNTTTGALGARIAQALAAGSSRTCAATFALPPRFLPQGPRDEILRVHGLDACGISATILKRLAHMAELDSSLDQIGWPA